MSQNALGWKIVDDVLGSVKSSMENALGEVVDVLVEGGLEVDREVVGVLVDGDEFVYGRRARYGSLPLGSWPPEATQFITTAISCGFIERITRKERVVGPIILS